MFTWRHGSHVGGVNKETAAMLEEWSILLGIELYFYANSSFCFIMQIWLLVAWAKTLYINGDHFIENFPVLMYRRQDVFSGQHRCGYDMEFTHPSSGRHEEEEKRHWR